MSGPAPDRSGPDPRGRSLLIALGGLSAFGPLCLDMYLPALPTLAADLRSTATWAQLSLSACIVGLAAGQLVVGPWSDRVGRRTPLLAGLVLFTVSSAACALVTSLPLLVLLRLLQGFGGAAGIVVSRAVVTDRFTGRVAAATFATLAAINGLAPIVAPLLGAQILRVGGWRTVFWVLAAIGVLLVLAALAWVPESLPPDRRRDSGGLSTGRAFLRLGTDRVFLGWVAAGTLVAAAMFGYISASPFLLQNGYRLSAQAFSICFATNALGIVALSQLGRRLVHRVRPETLLIFATGQCLAGAVLLAGALAGRWPLALVLVALFVMVSAVGLALPFSAVLAMARHPGIAGSASALFGTAQYALAAVAAPLVGLGDRSRGAALAVTALVAALIAVTVANRTRRVAG